MKIPAANLGAIAAGSVFVAGAAATAPAGQAMDGNKSLASVLDVGNAKLDKSNNDFDILTKAAEAVLAAKPDSRLALLADGDTALAVFAPTDKAFKNLASALAGHSITSESDAFQSNGAVLATAAEGKDTKVLVSDAPSIRLRDYAPELKNPRVIFSAVDINEGNMQIAHGVDAVMLPFAP